MYKKMKYDEVQEKGKKKNMRLQVENEFQQVKIKDLNVTVFMTNIRGGKAFAAEQNIRELKTRISMLKAISDKNKAKIPPKYIIKQSVENMNNVRSEKYNISPNEIKKRSLASKQFKTLFNFERIKKSKQIPDRLDKYDQKKIRQKKQKTIPKLNIDEKMLMLAERIKKKLHLVNFTNKLFKTFHILTKKMFFVITNKKILIIKHFTG